MRQRLKSYVKENTLLCRSVYLIFPKITRINIVFASLNKFLIILVALNTQTQLPGRNIDPLILAMTQQKILIIKEIVSGLSGNTDPNTESGCKYYSLKMWVL